MAQQKRSTPRKAAEPVHAPEVKALPFPGESPTVSLALAAARMYGLPPEDEAKPAEAAPRHRGATKKKPAKAGGKARTSAKRRGA